ncbi:MAG: gas vesicle protein [Armatimonadota bacterium]|nr:gas vesicle protein [Armatimonadota bacterium]
MVGEDSKRKHRRSTMSVCEMADMAREQIAQLTGYKPDSVTSLSREEDGWRVTVDVVELNRVPASADLLGAYLALLDDDGNVVNYRRIRRYCRGEAIEVQ